MQFARAHASGNQQCIDRPSIFAVRPIRMHGRAKIIWNHSISAGRNDVDFVRWIPTAQPIGIAEHFCRPEDVEGPHLLEAPSDGAILAPAPFVNFSPRLFLSSILLERSSPSRVRCAAPNNGAPLTAPGRSEETRPPREKGSLQNPHDEWDHFGAKMAPFLTATVTGLAK